MPSVHAAPASASGWSASCAAVIARSAAVHISSVSDAHTTSCCTSAYTSAKTALAARLSCPSAVRAAIRASVTSRGSTRPTSVRCSAEACQVTQASAVRDASAPTSAGPAGTDSSGARIASRIAGTASCGMRANDPTGTDAPPRSMSMPARTATSPTASASASLTSRGSLGGSRVPRSIPFSQDGDMPTSPASTGRVRPFRSRRIWIRSPVRLPGQVVGGHEARIGPIS